MSQLILPGTASPSDVLTGKTFSAGTHNAASGTMPDQGNWNATPGPNDIPVPAGKHGGGGKVAAVAVPADKVLAGTTIAGTAGTMPNRGALTALPGSTYPAGYYSGVATPSGYKAGDAIPYQNLGLGRPPMATFDQYPTSNYQVIGAGVDLSGSVWLCWNDGYLRKYNKQGALLAAIAYWHTVPSTSKMIMSGDDIFLLFNYSSTTYALQKWNAATGTKVLENTAIVRPVDMDLFGTSLYVVGYNTIYKVNTWDLSVAWASNSISAYMGNYIVVEKATGTYLYVVYSTTNGATNYIKKLYASTAGEVWNQYINTRNKSIGIYNDGSLYMQGGKYNANFGKMWQHSPITGESWYGPVHVSANNDVVFTAADRGNGSMHKLNSAGQMIWYIQGLLGDVDRYGRTPNSLYYDEAEGCYYVSDCLTKRVLEKIKIPQ